jgi:hypothetical protein
MYLLVRDSTDPTFALNIPASAMLFASLYTVNLLIVIVVFFHMRHIARTVRNVMNWPDDVIYPAEPAAAAVNNDEEH